MMTKLREFSKIFIVIVAASFIGLMVFEWGADYSGRSQVNDTVGSVNDQTLSYSKFSDMYQQLYQEQRARSGEKELTDQDLQQLRDQVWERFIQQTLLSEEMDKLGITVSDSEIVYQIYNYPLEDFKQHPSFQTDGVFDINKYRNAFSDPNIPWMQVEDIYRQQIPFIKLQNIVTNTVRISDEEVLDEFEQNEIKVKVEYLGVNATSFNNPDIEVSDDEVNDYYNKNKEDYERNEQRALSYVIFPIATTATDTAHLVSEFESVRKRLKNGENFNDLALEYSEDPSVRTNNGDLGFFARGDMLTAFSDAAFAAKIGDVVGPIQTSYGMHLIKVEDKKTEDGKEKVKASHILMKVTPAPSRVEEIESMARFFSEDAKETGFETQATASELEVQTSSLFEERSGFVPGIGRNLAVANFAFASELNTVSGIYKIDQGYAVFLVKEIQEAGYQDLESVKRIIENRVRFEKAKEQARTFAGSLSAQVKSAPSFKNIADQDESKNVKYEVSGLFNINGSVPGVGKSVSFNGAAFALEENEKSDMVETERGFYFLNLLEKTAFDSSSFEAQKEPIKRRLLGQKRNQIFMDWYTSLKDEADIVDNRKMFNL